MFTGSTAAGYSNLYVIIEPRSSSCVKMAVLLYLYFWLRWTFPRYRYDQLMDLGWKWMIPASLINIVLDGVWRSSLCRRLTAGAGCGPSSRLAAGFNLTREGQG